VVLVESSIRQPSAIVCFFLVYIETVIIKEKKSSSPSNDISCIIFKRRDDANREGNSVTNAHVTRGP
jgi:hypothetical protein